MKRHNRVLTPNDVGNRADFDAWVEEHYTYNGVGGAISQVQTVIGTGDPGGLGGDTDNTRPVFDDSIEPHPPGRHREPELPQLQPQVLH